MSVENVTVENMSVEKTSGHAIPDLVTKILLLVRLQNNLLDCDVLPSCKEKGNMFSFPKLCRLK